MKKLTQQLKTTTTILSLGLLSASLQAGIVEPHTLWNKTEVETCWYDQEDQLALTRIGSVKKAKEVFDFKPRELSRREKKKVKETVMANFSPETTGINFVGWKSCSEVQSPDLIVMEAKSKVFLLDRPSWNGRATIGEEGIISRDIHGEIGFYGKSKRVPHVALYTQKRGTVVHEFGHIAGLRHEHIRPEAKLDKTCHNPFVPLDFDKPEELETPFITSVFVTEYDPQSIMNYCWLITRRSEHNRNKGMILSKGDRETLLQYYR